MIETAGRTLEQPDPEMSERESAMFALATLVPLSGFGGYATAEFVNDLAAADSASTGSENVASGSADVQMASGITANPGTEISVPSHSSAENPPLDFKGEIGLGAGFMALTTLAIAAYMRVQHRRAQGPGN